VALFVIQKNAFLCQIIFKLQHWKFEIFVIVKGWRKRPRPPLRGQKGCTGNSTISCTARTRSCPVRSYPQIPVKVQKFACPLWVLSVNTIYQYMSDLPIAILTIQLFYVRFRWRMKKNTWSAWWLKCRKVPYIFHASCWEKCSSLFVFYILKLHNSERQTMWTCGNSTFNKNILPSTGQDFQIQGTSVSSVLDPDPDWILIQLGGLGIRILAGQRHVLFEEPARP
jgi:hypothetical protein